MAGRKKLEIRGAKEFENDMVRLIAEEKDRHKVSWFKMWLEEFNEYRKCYEGIVTTENSLSDFYIVKFAYTRKTPVWREILAKGSDTLDDLAACLIDSMGWDNDHLHQFLPRTVNGQHQGFYSPLAIKLGYPEDDEDWPSYKTQVVRMADIDWEKWPKWNFAFDFGDDHTFNVDFKEKITKAEARKRHYFEYTPILIDQRGVAPVQYPDWEALGLEDSIDNNMSK